jgi:hypothetical protein
VHAAKRALRQVFGDRRDPLDLVRSLGSGSGSSLGAGSS